MIGCCTVTARTLQGMARVRSGQAPVVAEYDAAPPGHEGAVLHREGLYSSHVIEWRRVRDSGSKRVPASHQKRKPSRTLVGPAALPVDGRPSLFWKSATAAAVWLP